MGPRELEKVWERAYRTCGQAQGEDIVNSSIEVANAWRSLAEKTPLSWWLRAAVFSAAEAFEHQAQAWAAYRPDREGEMATAARHRR